MKKRFILIQIIILMCIIICSSCDNSNKVDEIIFLPDDLIDISEKQLGYIYPTSALGMNSNLYIDYTKGKNFPIVNEHFVLGDACYGEINEAGGTPLTFDITLYPVDLSFISIRIKPIQGSNDFNNQIGKKGVVNIYNNNTPFGYLKYETSKDVKMTYSTLEQYLIDNFMVLSNIQFEDVLSSNDEVINDSKQSYQYIDKTNFLCRGLDYNLAEIFVDKNDSLFNTRNLSITKFYYLDYLGNEENKNYSLKVEITIKNILNINLENLDYLFYSTSNNCGKVILYILEDSKIVGLLSLESSLNLEGIYEEFLNTHFNK